MKGRKRHIVVDTLGLPLAVVVHPADIQDRDGARLVLTRLLGRFPRLQLIWADGAYGGKLVEWARTVGGWTLELVRRPPQQHTFQVLPRRWVVERTFGWLNLQRRLSKDYEALCETTETWIYIAMTGLTLRRLARLPIFRHPLRSVDNARTTSVEALSLTRYFVRQADWLHDRFPEAELQDVEGLVKLVDRTEIEAQGWSLTPGRYVGVAPEEEDEDFDFEEAMQSVHADLEELNQEAVELAHKILRNYKELVL